MHAQKLLIHQSGQRQTVKGIHTRVVYLLGVFNLTLIMEGRERKMNKTRGREEKKNYFKTCKCSDMFPKLYFSQRLICTQRSCMNLHFHRTLSIERARESERQSVLCQLRHPRATPSVQSYHCITQQHTYTHTPPSISYPVSMVFVHTPRRRR